MGSDRARKTWDQRQKYRGVVFQQGRVSVEADVNEADDIRAADSRAELLAIVGPSGTPDDGYRLSLPAVPPTGWVPYDFQIGAGSFFVGGVRVTTDAIRYFQQPDWVDGPELPVGTPQRELVALVLSEQEVSAVEDRSLREVALGGPDTAQRRRWSQHVVRVPVGVAGCGPALDAVSATWAKAGLQLDLASRELRSTSRLLADFVPPTAPVNECEPGHQAGFLGVENQLIRVQVSGAGKLLWGYDNASFLYRITAGSADVMTLQSAPVDVFHQPRAGQYVEVLRAGAQLGSGEHAAAETGFVVRLAGDYDADTQTVRLQNALPAIYRDASKTPALFLRVWEAELDFTAGVPVVLGDTGVRVSLSGGPFPLGDFWSVGVRPSQPHVLFPDRLRTASQPPDGPRRLVTSLGVISWSGPTAASIEDCRDPFDDLVELTRRGSGGCCTIKIRPQDVKGGAGLQELLDRHAGKGERVRICFAAGRYELAQTLRLGKQHSKFVLEGCTDGVVFTQAPDSREAFADGLLVLTQANEVELRQLRFDLPLGALGPDDFVSKEAFQLVRKQAGDASLYTSIGVNAIHCANLSVIDCLFRFTLAEDGFVFAAGLKMQGGSWWPRFERCRFLHDQEYLRRPRDLNQVTGLIHLPYLFADVDIKNDPPPPIDVTDELSLDDCQFAGLDIAVLMIGNLGGLHLERNVVRECRGGFLLANHARELPPSPDLRKVSPEKLRASLTAWAEPFSSLGLLVHRTTANPTLARSGVDVLAAPLSEEAASRVATIEKLITEPAAAASDLGQDAARLELLRLSLRLSAIAVGRPTEYMTLRLHFNDNDVRTMVLPDPTRSFGLLVHDNDWERSGEFLVNDNLFRGSQEDPLVRLEVSSRGAITGNVITNLGAQGEGKGSLGHAMHLTIYWEAEESLTPVAITGNSFYGDIEVPTRHDVDEPFRQWKVFNAMTYRPAR